MCTGLTPATTALQAFVEDRFGQDGGGGGAVAGDVAGLGGDFADHPGAHVFVDVFQVDFLGDGHAVLGDGRRAEALLQNHVAALGAERDFDGPGQLGNAAAHRVAGFLIECNHLCHVRDYSSCYCELWLLRVRMQMTVMMQNASAGLEFESILAFNHGQNVFLAHQQQFLVADLELLAGVAGEQHAVAGLHLQRLARAVVEQLAVADANRPCRAPACSWPCRAARCRRPFCDSDSSRSTTTRSPSGCKRTLLVLFGFGLVAVALMLMLSPRLLGRYSK